MSESLNDANRQQAKSFINQISGMPVQQLVFNNALSLATASEIQTCILFGQRPLALLIINPAVAKTLAVSLMARVREYEAMVGHEVKTLDEIGTVRESV